MLKIREAARALGVSEKTLRRWDQRGIWVAHRDPRNNYRLYPRSEVEAWARARLCAPLQTNSAPPPRTSFVGRGDALRQLEKCFAEGALLVTIAGPPGVGKTRLAVEYSRSFEESACFIELAGLAIDADVTEHIAVTLGLPLQPNAPHTHIVATLARAVAARGTRLIVLDNAEHLVGALAPFLSVCLQSLPARLLVTSRQPVEVAGERLVELEPFVRALAGETDEAVELFVDRAKAARGDYSPSPAEREVIAELVHRLDGIPLAIELAAARMDVLDPGQLLERISARFELLGRSADSAYPHDTLHSAIEWSWRSLNDVEQRVLAGCSIFIGEVSATACEHVLGVSGVLDALHSLRKKGLLREIDGPGERRLGLYESLREFVATKLDDGERAALALRHADYFLSTGEATSNSAYSHAGMRARLARDRENLLGVARRGLSQELPDGAVLALRALLVLEPLLWVHGQGTELCKLWEEVLECAESQGAPLPFLAAGYLARGRARRLAGRTDDCRQDLERAQRLAEDGQNARLLGRVLLQRATHASTRGRLSEALELYQRAMSQHSASGDNHFEGRNLNGAGVICMHLGLWEDAADFYRRSFEIHAAEDDLWMMGVVLGNLAILALERRQLEQARAIVQRAMVTTSQAGAHRAHAICVATSGRIWHDAGDLAAAQNELGLAVREHRVAADARFEALAELSLGLIHEESGREHAARHAYETGLRLSANIGDRRCQARALIYLARLDETADLLAQADSMLAEAGDPSATTLIRLVSVHLALRKDARQWKVAWRELETPELIGAFSAEVRASRRLVLRDLDRAVFLQDESDAIRVDQESGRIRLPGLQREIVLGETSPVHRLLLGLIEQRRHAPGCSLTVDALFAAGWPGQKASGESKSSRVKVAISKLRRLGLRPWLEHWDGGYRLSPGTWVAKEQRVPLQNSVANE